MQGSPGAQQLSALPGTGGASGGQGGEPARDGQTCSLAGEIPCVLEVCRSSRHHVAHSQVGQGYPSLTEHYLLNPSARERLLCSCPPTGVAMMSFGADMPRCHQPPWAPHQGHCNDLLTNCFCLWPPHSSQSVFLFFVFSKFKPNLVTPLLNNTHPMAAIPSGSQSLYDCMIQIQANLLTSAPPPTHCPRSTDFLAVS